jgi:superfamily II DNA or RNA helicase
MADYIIDIKIGNTQKLIVLTTYNSFSSKDFIRIIKNNSAKIFLIVDEVHGVGAPQRKKGLIEDYDFRLGLSATPKRWFDLEGTEKLFNYFGGIVFKFSLKEAINQVNPNTGKTYLAPYEYKPYFIGLTEAELIKYKEDTRKIRKAYYQAKDDEEKEDVFNRLCIKRQDIIKNAVNKYKKFEEIIDQLGELKHCLIYCSPQQVNKVKNIIDKKGIIWHEFTQNEGTKSMKKYEGLSERQFILKEFAKGTYQALVAMKILDEGVDVPPARIAILLCSSGNPRQYIQRRGRILRHHPGKKKAIIHDIIVIPEISPNVDKGFSDLEKKIVKKEIKRYKEFSDVAINRLECLEKIDELEERYDMTLWG